MASGDATVAAPTVWAMRTDKVFIAFEVSHSLTPENQQLQRLLQIRPPKDFYKKTNEAKVFGEFRVIMVFLGRKR